MKLIPGYDNEKAAEEFAQSFFKAIDEKCGADETGLSQQLDECGGASQPSSD